MPTDDKARQLLKLRLRGQGVFVPPERPDVVEELKLSPTDVDAVDVDSETKTRSSLDQEN